MEIVIVAKTRMGSGACVGGITYHGQSVRLIAGDAQTNEQFNQEYSVGDIWEVDYDLPAALKPPHVENIIIRNKKKLSPIEDLQAFIEQHQPPVCGSVEVIYDGLAQHTRAGAQYIAARSGIPAYSTHFWRPDMPLTRDLNHKRIRYRYPTADGGRTVTFVGFQESLAEIPAHTLLRISLAHWWRPQDREDAELRCYVQLSGWYGEQAGKCIAVRGTPLLHSETRLGSEAAAEPLDVLRKVFGHSEFRPLQAEVIENVLGKRDSLAIMPTGSGKSLCYQLPALLFPGLTVVVSPLIALMQDQVEQARQHGIAAEFLNSTLALADYIRVTERVRDGQVKLLYAAPETLLRPETMLLLEESKVDCLTIDEAHCISAWGHEFRPEYRQLVDLRRRLPEAVCLAVTATATERVRQDIRQTLDVNDADEFIASFDRENLFLSAMKKDRSRRQIQEFLDEHRGEAGIIYCSTRNAVDQLCEHLASKGWPCLPYHAGLDQETRKQNQRRFIYEDGQIMVATIAFGMGINKSNVRFVIHLGLPKNLESYYQQIGRAGRDGLRADCLLLYGRADMGTIGHFIEQEDESHRQASWLRLRAMMDYAQTTRCRRPLLLTYFGESAPVQTCDMCDNCLTTTVAGSDDLTIPAQKFLSCVLRTRQIFGPAHIIQVLRGSNARRVKQHGHDRLSTFGIGQEFSRYQWRDMVEQFVQLGLLERDAQYGSLRLTDEGREVLRGKIVLGTIPPKRREKDRSAPLARDQAYDADLFERLRVKRLQLARQMAVPPYVIFSDRSLSEMAASMPRTEEEFARIGGVGTYKLKNYAAEFLPLIQSYCAPEQAAD